MWRHWRFVLSNNFATSASEEEFILKNISTEEASGETDEFHDSQKCLGQSSNKNFQIFSWILYVFQIYSGCVVTLPPPLL